MESTFEIFALVELFGHTRIAGTVTEQSIGGSTFIRVDVPETKREPAFTRFLNPSAVYALNPVTSEIMHELAETIKSKPVTSYDVSKTVAKHMEGMRLLAGDEGNQDMEKNGLEDGDDIGF